MKKLLSLTLAVLIMSLCTASVFAADPPASQTKSSALTYSVTSTYTIEIPADIEISTADKTGTIAIAASDVYVDEGNKLSITLTNATNKTAGKDFRLKAGLNTFIDYSVKIGANDVALGGEVLAVPAGTQTGNVTLALTADTATISGAYSDTLTFTAAVVSAA